MMKKLLMLFMFIPFNCFSQKTIDLMNHLSNTGSLPLSEIASEVQYIPLETTDECLLSEELQIYWAENEIFVGDQQAMKFYRFDRSGKFLNTIGEQGDGPKAYPYAIGFYVNEKEKCIYIIGIRNNTLYQYAYDGTFQRKLPLSNVSWSIGHMDTNIVCYNIRYNRVKGQKNVAELYLFDKNGKEITKRPTTAKESDDMLLIEQPFFYSYQNQLFYKNTISDMVYLLDKDLKMIPHYRINTGKNNQHGKDDYKDLRKYAQKISVRNIFETATWRWIMYTHKHQMGYLAYHKQTEKCFTIGEGTNPGFKDDIHGGPLFQPMQYGGSQGGHLLSLMTANEACEKNVADQYASLQKLQADDNPIVVVVTLK